MSRAHVRWSSPKKPSFYCARCLGLVEASQRVCPGCACSFAGTGRFDLLSGSPPSSRMMGWLHGDRS